MRVRTLLSIEPEDQTSLKRFIETTNILGLWWKFEEGGQAQKVFKMVQANEFTLEEARWAVAYVIREAEARMAAAYAPTGICFYHGAEQEKGFQDSIFHMARRAKEDAEYFLETLLEDLRDNRNEEGVRAVNPNGKRARIAKKKIEDQTVAHA